MSTRLNNATTLELLLPVAATQTSEASTATGISIKDFSGPVMFQVHSAVPTGNADNTCNGKITHCATVDGSYTDVTGAAFAEIDDTAGGSLQNITANANEMLEFVKFVGTIAGTTPSFMMGASVTGIKQVH